MSSWRLRLPRPCASVALRDWRPQKSLQQPVHIRQGYIFFSSSGYFFCFQSDWSPVQSPRVIGALFSHHGLQYIYTFLFAEVFFRSRVPGACSVATDVVATTGQCENNNRPVIDSTTGQINAFDVPDLDDKPGTTQPNQKFIYCQGSAHTCLHLSMRTVSSKGSRTTI